MTERISCRPVRRHLATVLAWTLLWALFFLTILVGVDHFQAGDFSGQFHAFGAFQARELAQGRLPAWSPGSYAGVPFAADPQAAVYYPPRVVTILLSLPWGFPYYALELEVLAHVWLAGLFAYALAYSITRQPLASLVGAVTFALGGYLTSYPLLQVAILETIAWLPLALLLLRVAAARSRPVPWLIAAGLALGCSALAGHPQTWLHGAYLAAAYYVFLSLRARWPWRWVLGLGALVAAVAVGVWSAALWPALQYLSYTSRSGVSYAFVSTGLPLLDYLQTLVPGVLSLWSPEYWGVAALVLAVVAFLGRRRADRAEVVFWVTAAVLSAWLALGDSGILFELAYRIAPGFSLFQHQERLLGVFSLSCAMLAAQGMALWLAAAPGGLSGLVRRSASGVGGALLLAGLVLAVVIGLANRAWLGTWARQAMTLAVVFGLLYGERWREQRAWLLILVLGADLYLATLGAVGREPGPPGAFWPQPGWVRTAQSAGLVRIDSGGLFYGNLGELYGVEDIRGISPLRPRALEDMKQLPPARRWQLLNVGYVIASGPPPDAALTKVADVGEAIEPGKPLQAALYRFDGALPRAWMSYSPERVSDRNAALKRLADASFDPATSVILEGEAGSPAATMSPPAKPQVRTARTSSSALQIDVTTQAPGFLVISEWYYPGWQARLDGQPVPIERADYALQAVEVSAGAHTIVLTYAPAVNRAGAIASVLALIVAGALAWCWRPAIPCHATGQECPQQAPGLVRRPGSSRRAAWLCSAIVLVGFGFRAWTLGSQELRGDEAFSYLLARLPLKEILPALLRQGDPHSPLHYWLLHVWMGPAGDSELAMRFISFVPSVLLLPLLYRLGKRLGGGTLGLIAAGLAATSQSLVWIGQDLRNQYTLAILFSLLATMQLAEAMERPAWWRWGLYALLGSLTLYSHYYGAFALVAQGFAVLAIGQWRKHWKEWAAGIGIVGLSFLPWFLSMWHGLVAAGQLSAPSHPELAAHLTAVGVELTVGSAFASPLARWLFVACLVVAGVGVGGLWVRGRGWAVMLGAWVATAALGIYLLRFTRSTFNAFYILVAAVPWWLLVAAGLQRLWAHRPCAARAAAAIAAAVLVGCNGLSLCNYYSNPLYNRSSGYRGVAEQVAALAQLGDVFLRNFPDPCYDYYLRDVPVPRAMAPLTAQASPQETERALSGLAAQYDRLWFVSAQGSSWDPRGVVSHWLEYNALLERQARYGNLLLQAYRPMHSAEQVMVPLGSSVEGLVSLRGAYVTVNGQPVDPHARAAIPPGATVQVTLLWQALARTNLSYTVFVHLLGDDGRLLAQHDGIPVFGASPTWSWQPGQKVLDRHDLVVPASAHAEGARLLVGIYESQSVVRQHWTDGQDAVELARHIMIGHAR